MFFLPNIHPANLQFSQKEPNVDYLYNILFYIDKNK